MRDSLRQATARGTVDITGEASVSDHALTMVWRGGGMVAFAQNLPGKGTKATETYRLACSFTAKIGPGGLSGLQIAKAPRASLRVDGESYVHTTEGWLRQIDKHFKPPTAPAATGSDQAEPPK